ncbi:MAG: hypothetical protein AAB091_05245 [Elusimicrobiota bacterium]
MRNSFAGETVIAGNWGDPENQILINYGDGDQHSWRGLLGVGVAGSSLDLTQVKQ